MRVMEHSYGKHLATILGAICGCIKWIMLQVNHVDVSRWQALGWALIVAGSCGAASAAGNTVWKWMIKYSTEFLKNKKFIK